MQDDVMAVTGMKRDVLCNESKEHYHSVKCSEERVQKAGSVQFTSNKQGSNN